MTLLYLRHGQTDWNAKGLVQGRTDIPLNETGREQARNRAAELVSHRPPVEIIYASPLLRARKTAEIIHQGIDVPLRFDDRLAERYFGTLEGTKTMWWLSESECALHGAESSLALYERVSGFLDELAARHAGQTVLVVAHGCVARMVHWYFHGQDETDTAKHGNAILRCYDKKLAGERPAFTG